MPRSLVILLIVAALAFAAGLLVFGGGNMGN